MAKSATDALRVDVPVGFLLPEAREILVSVDRAAGPPRSIRLRLIPAETEGRPDFGATPESSLDDTLDVFPCHGVGGLVGMIATGVFAKDVGLIHGNPKTFLMHLLAIVIVGAFTFVGSYILYKVVDAITPMRVARTDEEVGLDLSQHGEIAAVATNGHAKKVPIWGLEKTA